MGDSNIPYVPAPTRPWPYLPSSFLYVAGVVFLAMLPNSNFNRKNFFDENALMAGLVKREFMDTKSISGFVSQLKTVASNE
jgi:hypothetical protein